MLAFSMGFIQVFRGELRCLFHFHYREDFLRRLSIGEAPYPRGLRA